MPTGAAFAAGRDDDDRPGLISAVEADLARASAKTVVAFGDLITDGVGSTLGADCRWAGPAPIRAERLLHASNT